MSRAFSPLQGRSQAQSREEHVGGRATLDPVVELQRLVGNGAVRRLIQPNLVAANGSDSQERQADSVILAAARPRSATPGRCACGGLVGPSGECGACRRRRLAGRDSTLGPRGGAISSAFARSPSRPLDREIRTDLEARLGTDLGRVRIHTSPGAASAAASVGADAFTVGSDVVFAHGRYNPDSDSGRQLISHELVHVAQQSAGAAVALQRQQAPQQGQTAENVVGIFPRPPGLPLNEGFLLEPLPQESAALFANLPEGQIVPLAGTGFGTGGQPIAFSSGGSQGITGWDIASYAGRPGLAGASTGLWTNVNLTAQRLGFAAAGADAIGLVAIPQSPGLLGRVQWGHTAIYVRSGGEIQAARGFTPIITQMLGKTSDVLSGEAATAGQIKSGIGMFKSAEAVTIEYPVTPELAKKALQTLPQEGPTSTLYTARPSVAKVCIGTNCVLLAVEEAERLLGGQIGPGGGPSVTAIPRGGVVEPVPLTASQGKLVGFIESVAESKVATSLPEEAVGPAVAAQFPKRLSVLRWGGRIFLVAGALTVPAEVYFAKPEEKARTAIGASAGFLGGLGAGAVAGLACGPGAPVCSIVLGLTFGILGGLAARGTAEAIYDVSTGRVQPRPGASSTALDFPVDWCFSADTPVELPDQLQKPIRELAPGDEVLSYDEESHSIRPCRVIRVIVGPPSPALRFELEDGSAVRVTAPHLLRGLDGWLHAGELVEGDVVRILSASSGALEVRRIVHVTPVPADGPVCDLSVEDCNTYFAAGVLAHNKGP